MVAYGLIAGLGLRDMEDMRPGVILDLYVYRRNYDDMENGIRREPDSIYD